MSHGGRTGTPRTNFIIDVIIFNFRFRFKIILYVFRHNLHHYMKFFEEIREAIANGTLQNLEDLVFIQFDEHLKKVPNNDECVLVDEN